MRVCLASMHFAPVYSGPALRFQRYAPGLRQRGIDLSVFSAVTDDSPGAEEAVPRQEVNIDGLPVMRTRIAGPARNGRTLRRFSRSLFWHCYETVRRPELIHFLSLSQEAAPWMLALRRLSIPLMFTHTMLSEQSPNPWKRRLQRLYWPIHFQTMDCTVVSSSVMRDNLREIGVRNRIEVIPNGVDLQRFQPVESPVTKAELRLRLGFCPEDEIIVFVGSISPRKGLDLLMEAWGEIARRRPKARLLLVGPKHEEIRKKEDVRSFKESLDSSLSESGAADRVHYTGPVAEPEVYLRLSDVFVFPSRREGMPNVVLEAFGCGLPSILTPFLGLPAEFGRPDREYLLVQRDSRQLSRAIIAVLSNRELRTQLGGRARAWVQNNLGLDRSLDLYADLYRDLGSQRLQA
ncbi:MAG: glycosyltransferase family 1 protein [Acidobacteria bacterium]|nr:MAG: glycosyltransferase family 1 protein [Acidobacteriota bacterium]